MLKTLKKIIAQINFKIREKNTLKTCGCACYCPKCKDILNDRSEWCGNDFGFGFYVCNSCRHKSNWHFGIAPFPILIDGKHSNEKRA